MIKKPHRPIFRAALLLRNFQPLADCLFAHWLMRAESDHDVERRSTSTDLSEQAFEEHAQGTCSRSVRDDQKYFFPAIFRSRASFPYDLEHLLVVEVRARRTAQ